MENATGKARKRRLAWLERRAARLRGEPWYEGTLLFKLCERCKEPTSCQCPDCEMWICRRGCDGYCDC